MKLFIFQLRVSNSKFNSIFCKVELVTPKKYFCKKLKLVTRSVSSFCELGFVTRFRNSRIPNFGVISLLLIMQSNEKKYKGAESEETKKNKKNHSIAKKEFDHGSCIYEVRKNSLNIDPPVPLYPQLFSFDLRTLHSWTSLKWHSKLPLLG